MLNPQEEKIAPKIHSTPSNRRFIYEQRTGIITDPNGKFFVLAYSGHGEGLNNPDLEWEAKVGPLPKGVYKIGPLALHDRLGMTMSLTQISGKSYGRGAFFWHGDNQQMNHTGSEGCVVSDKISRAKAASSGVDLLEVV